MPYPHLYIMLHLVPEQWFLNWGYYREIQCITTRFSEWNNQLDIALHCCNVLGITGVATETIGYQDMDNKWLEMNARKT